MQHSILAPDFGSAARLAKAIALGGYHSRHTQYGTHQVVLAIAPIAFVNEVCRVISFEPGTKVAA